MPPQHEQHPFVDYYGNTVDVDEGIIHILTRLKQLGVQTYFSCQGGEEKKFDGRAYVLTKMSTMWPLLKVIYKLHRSGAYSVPVRQLVKSFLHSAKEIDIWLFEQSKNGSTMSFHHDGKKGGVGYVLAFSYSTKSGFRITVRWPHKESNRVFQLLQETYEYGSQE